MPWRFLSPPAAPLSLCQAMGWAPTGFAPPHGSQTPSFTATCQNTHLCSRTTAREINQYNTTQAARSPTTKKPQTLSDWLDRLPAYLALSVWENSLPIQVYRAACYNSFVTTQIRQGKAILNHLSPPRSTAPIYMTFIKNPFIPKVNQGWNRYQLCMSWLSKMCYSVCLI